MSARWRKKSEIEGKKPQTSNDDTISENLSIKIEFNDYGDYSRVRDISRTEKFYRTIEKGAISLTKINYKFKNRRKKEKKIPNGDSKEIQTELTPGIDQETFHRLITCVFSEQYLDEFLSVMQALNFKDLGGLEYLGRRDADYSIAKDLDLIYRLHARVYRIMGNVFLLLHHEPKATQDVKLHIKGYFDRILNSILQEELLIKENNEDVSNPIKKKKKKKKYDLHSGSGPGEERIELSDYEKGSDIFLKMLKENVPNFYRKLKIKIGDEELKLWIEFLGKIDHISQEETILENVYESSRLIPPFTQIRDSVKKIFKYLNFEIEPAWDLNVSASDKYFISKTADFKSIGIKKRTGFKILVITEDFIDDVMRPIGLLRSKYKPTFVVLISPDISIFGPTNDDVPPKNIELPKFDYNKKEELINFLTESKINIIPISILIELFRIHLENPLRYSHIELLLNKNNLITLEMINDLIQNYDVSEKFIEDVLKIFNIFMKTKNLKWISMKILYKMIKEEQIELNDEDVRNIIFFMENPILGLIESKKGKRKDYRLIPNLSEEEIENNKEKMIQVLEQYLI